MKGRHRDRRTQADPFCALAERGDQHRRRHTRAVPIEMMLAEPERIEAQLFGPLGHGENFFVVFLIRAAQLRMVVAENEDAEFHRLTGPNSRAWDSVDKHLTCAHRAYRRSRSFSSRRRSEARRNLPVWLCRRVDR